MQDKMLESRWTLQMYTVYNTYETPSQEEKVTKSDVYNTCTVYIDAVTYTDKG